MQGVKSHRVWPAKHSVELDVSSWVNSPVMFGEKVDNAGCDHQHVNPDSSSGSGRRP